MKRFVIYQLVETRREVGQQMTISGLARIENGVFEIEEEAEERVNELLSAIQGQNPVYVIIPTYSRLL